MVVSDGGSVAVSSPDASSGSRPRSYRSWAAGGRDGWRYQEEARLADFPRVCLPILGFRKMYSFLLFLLYFCFQIPIDSYDV